MICNRSRKSSGVPSDFRTWKGRGLSQELRSLQRPSPSHCGGEDHQPRTTPCWAQGASTPFFTGLLPRPSHHWAQLLSWQFRRGAVVTHGGVHGELCSWEQWQTVNDNLQTATVDSRLCHIQPWPSPWWRLFLQLLCTPSLAAQSRTAWAPADFCIFGSQYRKRTLFLVGNVEGRDLHRFARKCVETGGTLQCVWTKTCSSKCWRNTIRILFFTWPHPPSPFLSRLMWSSPWTHDTSFEWNGIFTQRVKGYWYGSYWLGAYLWIRINGGRGACYSGWLSLRWSWTRRRFWSQGQIFGCMRCWRHTIVFSETWWCHQHAHSSSLPNNTCVSLLAVDITKIQFNNRKFDLNCKMKKLTLSGPRSK